MQHFKYLRGGQNQNLNVINQDGDIKRSCFNVLFQTDVLEDAGTSHLISKLLSPNHVMH